MLVYVFVVLVRFCCWVMLCRLFRCVSWDVICGCSLCSISMTSLCFLKKKKADFSMDMVLCGPYKINGSDQHECIIGSTKVVKRAVFHRRCKEFSLVFATKPHLAPKCTICAYGFHTFGACHVPKWLFVM